MRTVFSNCRLLDPASERDELGGIAVEDGIIVDIGPHLKDTVGAIDCRGDCVAPGLIDMRVKTGEPGFEHRETLETASYSAVAGGITSMVVMPDTSPVIDAPALIDYLRRAGKSPKILNRILPAGALSLGLKGEKMTELGLMQEAGAVLFTNGDNPITSPNLLRRIMQYAKGVGATLMLRPDEPSIATGSMNASAFAARLGLRGLPVQAEWMGLSRDLIIAEMTGTSIIIDQISTARSLEMITDARKRGLNPAVTVAAHSLFFNELDIGDGSQDPRKAYLTYCKVNPPFRKEEDRLALIAGLKSGQIDCVVSAHDPQPPEDKRLPFDEASFGAAGLETVLPCLLTLVSEPEYELTLLDVLAAVTSRPADILGIDYGRLEVGKTADFVRFNPNKPWKCIRENLRSRSRNSPFDGRLLTGEVRQTIVGGNIAFNREDEASYGR